MCGLREWDSRPRRTAFDLFLLRLLLHFMFWCELFIWVLDVAGGLQCPFWVYERMRGILIGKFAAITRSLHPCFPQTLRSISSVLSPCQTHSSLLAKQTRTQSKLFPAVLNHQVRRLVTARGGRAMAQDYQPQLARQPPTVPLPPAPNGGKVNYGFSHYSKCHMRLCTILLPQIVTEPMM